MMMTRNILRFGRRQLHTIISREIIKPSSPTPSHLKTYKLSPLDQCAPHSYMPLILFYPNNQNCSLTADYKARELKKSLSHILTQYYPCAGRLHTPTTPYIDCNDEGVVFVEAKNDSPLAKFLHVNEHDETVNQLFADNMVWQNSRHSTCVLGVQLTHFSCGGLGVAVSMSHKIGDACTLVSYVCHWASVARYGSIDHKEVLHLNPHFIQFPDSTICVPPETMVLDQRCENFVTRKFVFPNSKLTDLQNKPTQCINKPTRFEALTSLLYRTAVDAASAISGSSNASSLLIPVDIRKKFVPKLPQTSLGNFITFMMIKNMKTDETSLSDLVSEIKKEKRELEGVQSLKQVCQHFESFLSSLAIEYVENGGNRPFWCSSLCGLSYKKVDFGWGKATGAAVILGSAHKTGSVLMDTPDGDGIEAWVVLEKEHMEVFQNDKEMLLFCQN